MSIISNKAMTGAQRRLNIEIGEICHAYLDAKWSFPNLRASFTRLYLPLAGEGILTFAGGEVRLRPGYIYIVPAGLPFACACPEFLEKIYVHLTLPHPNGSDVFAGVSECLVLEDKEGAAAEAARLCERSDVRSVLELKALLYGILARGLAALHTVPQELSEYSPLTEAAIAFVEAHLTASLTIDEVAEALFSSRPVLQKRFRTDVGKPLGRYIDDRLMKRGEQLLLDAALSVKDVSERLGFCDQFYFSRKFTQSHGVSPRVFRQMHGIGA